MTVNATADEVREITDAVVVERPDWGTDNTFNVLFGLRDRGAKPLRTAALRAAKHPSSHTPASIAFPMHWVQRVTSVSGSYVPLPECRNCGLPVARVTRLHFCPDCGAAWDPVEYREGVDHRTGHHLAWGNPA